jgi:hypothetical protein
MEFRESKQQECDTVQTLMEEAFPGELCFNRTVKTEH